MMLQLVTPPTVEPLTVAEVRERLHLSTTADDARLERLIVQARQWVERVTGRQLLPATWRLLRSDLVPPMILPKPPLRAVTSITYVDLAGATQTLSPSDYVVTAPSGPTAGCAVIDPAYGVVWPQTRGERASVAITFTAGYDLGTVPMIEALTWYVEYLYEPLDDGLREAALQALQPYRVTW